MTSHEVPIDLWHAALLMPIIWTFAACFYAGIRWERSRRPPPPPPPPGLYGPTSSSSGLTWSITPPPAPQAAETRATSRYDRPLRWVMRLFLRISAIGHRW